ncbi:small, acid-soluble spore protein, alpha/beta type [Alicyclobacillus pomorum]|uniref:small, acid-soluble spore protein, alpha/beta type n=2 Tax=Alicyclobacillus pomorum TaxID=204470 RepID=UPI003CCC2E5E
MWAVSPKRFTCNFSFARGRPETTAHTRKDPKLAQLMERMRCEIARELGLDAAYTGDFGNVSSKDCGVYGRLLQMRAKELVEGCTDDGG